MKGKDLFTSFRLKIGRNLSGRLALSLQRYKITQRLELVVPNFHNPVTRKVLFPASAMPITILCLCATITCRLSHYSHCPLTPVLHLTHFIGWATYFPDCVSFGLLITYDLLPSFPLPRPCLLTAQISQAEIACVISPTCPSSSSFRVIPHLSFVFTKTASLLTPLRCTYPSVLSCLHIPPT